MYARSGRGSPGKIGSRMMGGTGLDGSVCRQARYKMEIQ